MAQRFTTRPELRGSFGAVSATHWIGAAAGMGILERGGNAFDAACAAGFALQIVEPHLNGPGGDAVILLHKRGDAPRALCGQGVSPAAATIEAYHGLGLKAVPGGGLLAAVVPGAFDAWMLLLRDYGTMRLADILEPAIAYAEKGFPLVYRAAEAIHAIAPWFRDEWPTSAEVWLPGGKAPMPNDIVRTPAIADAFKRILAEAETGGGDREAQIEAARRAFYEGFVAEAIDRYCREADVDDTAGGRRKGLLTGDDLAGWRASIEDTLAYDYAGVRVHKTGPWGQGPAMLQALALLKGFDLKALAPDSARFVHIVVECLKLALADRDAYYADPQAVPVPMETLLSDDYNDARRKLIGDAASADFLPGVAANDAVTRTAALKELVGSERLTAPGGGEPTFADIPEIEGDTVHVDAVDRWGNMVAATPSGGWLQSSPAIPDLGFNLPTRAQMFWLDERLPSALRPGARPRTTLTPTIVTRDGEPCLALGSPGGDQQDQWSLTMLLRHVHHGLNLQAAIDAPGFNTRHLIESFYPRPFEPRRVLIEDRFGEGVLKDLKTRGHDLAVQDGWSLGRLCAVARGRDGTVRAAATPRFMQAYAVAR